MGQLPDPVGSYSELPYSKPELVKHLQYRHALSHEAINELELESRRKPRIDVTECSLCRTYATRLQQVNNSQKCDVTLAQFRSHLGGHFQQLALVAPPDTDNEADEDDEDLSEDDGSSDKIDSTLVLEEEPPPVASCPLFTEATQATSRGNTLSRVAGSRLPLSLTPISSHFKQRIH
jgi:hypothetical protein